MGNCILAFILKKVIFCCLDPFSPQMSAASTFQKGEPVSLNQPCFFQEAMEKVKTATKNIDTEIGLIERSIFMLGGT